MPFDSTPRRAPGRFLGWKLRLFFIAAVLLLIGMARGFNLLVLIAIALLGVAIALRFFERGRTEETPAEDEEIEGEIDGEEYAGELPAPGELRDTGAAPRQTREEPRRPMD